MQAQLNLSGVSCAFLVRNAARQVWDGVAFVDWSPSLFLACLVPATEQAGTGLFYAADIVGAASWELRIVGDSLLHSPIVATETLTVETALASLSDQIENLEFPEVEQIAQSTADAVWTHETGAQVAAEVHGIKLRFDAVPGNPVVIGPGPTEGDVPLVRVYIDVEPDMSDNTVTLKLTIKDPAPIIINSRGVRRNYETTIAVGETQSYLDIPSSKTLRDAGRNYSGIYIAEIPQFEVYAREIEIGEEGGEIWPFIPSI